LLSVVVEQPAELQSTEKMADIGACTDTVFGISNLLSYQFGPRLS
jgi:TnpA family transposase